MLIELNDVQAHAEGLAPSTLTTMIEGANARALRVAPCLADNDNDTARAEAKLILLGAIRRWCEAGSGAIAQTAAGPFQLTTDTRQRTGYNLWPTEITALQELCSTRDGEAYAIDTAPAPAYRPTVHPFLTGLNDDGNAW